MGTRPFPEIPCVICKAPVNLQTDLWTDENGKTVHADCYMKRIISAHLARTWAHSFSLSTKSRDVQRQQLL
jgi:hypothetical protein